jgi:hypothetical protein
MACPAGNEQNADGTRPCREGGERPADAAVGSSQAPPTDMSGRPPSQRLAVTAAIVACAGLVLAGFFFGNSRFLGALATGCLALALSFGGFVLGVLALIRARHDPHKWAGGAACAVVAVAMGSVMSAVLGLVVVSTWVLDGPRFESARSPDYENLRTIGLAASRYRNDHAGRYPATLGALVEFGYLDAGEIMPIQEDPNEIRTGYSGIGQYKWVGELPEQIPDETIIAFRRRHALTGGCPVLRADFVTDWCSEEKLTGPSGVLAQSYARLVEALGDQLTDERKAELRRFYEVAEDGQAPQALQPGASEKHG